MSAEDTIAKLVEDAETVATGADLMQRSVPIALTAAHAVWRECDGDPMLCLLASARMAAASTLALTHVSSLTHEEAKAMVLELVGDMIDEMAASRDAR